MSLIDTFFRRNDNPAKITAPQVGGGELPSRVDNRLVPESPAISPPPPAAELPVASAPANPWDNDPDMVVVGHAAEPAAVNPWDNDPDMVVVGQAEPETNAPVVAEVPTLGKIEPLKFQPLETGLDWQGALPGQKTNIPFATPVISSDESTSFKNAPKGPMGWKEVQEARQVRTGINDRVALAEAKQRLGFGRSDVMRGDKLTEEQSLKLYQQWAQTEGWSDNDLHLKAYNAPLRRPDGVGVTPEERRAMIKTIRDRDMETIWEQQRNADALAGSKTLLGHAANTVLNVRDMAGYMAQIGLFGWASVVNEAATKREERKGGSGFVDGDQYILTKEQQGDIQASLQGALDGVVAYSIEMYAGKALKWGGKAIGLDKLATAAGKTKLGKFSKELTEQVSRRIPKNEAISAASRAAGFDSLFEEIIVEEWSQAVVDGVDEARALENDGRRKGIIKAEKEALKSIAAASPEMAVTFGIFGLARAGAAKLNNSAGSENERKARREWLESRNVPPDRQAEVLAINEPKELGKTLLGIEKEFIQKQVDAAAPQAASALGLAEEDVRIALTSSDPAVRAKNLAELIDAEARAQADGAVGPGGVKLGTDGKPLQDQGSGNYVFTEENTPKAPQSEIVTPQSSIPEIPTLGTEPPTVEVKATGADGTVLGEVRADAKSEAKAIKQLRKAHPGAVVQVEEIPQQESGVRDQVSEDFQPLNNNQPQKGADGAKVSGVGKEAEFTGKPLTVYHGTDATFDTFDASKSGQNWPKYKSGGVHFASSPDGADPYGQNIIESEIVMKKPYVLDLDQPDSPEMVGLGRVTIDPDVPATTANTFLDQNIGGITRAAKKAGADAIVVKMDSTGAEPEFVVLDPSIIQIKATRDRDAVRTKDVNTKVDTPPAAESPNVYMKMPIAEEEVQKALDLRPEAIGGDTKENPKPQASSPKPLLDDLDNKNIPALKNVASREGVDLKGVVPTAPRIREAIRKARGQRSEVRGQRSETLDTRPTPPATPPAYSWDELKAMKQVALRRIAKEIGVMPGGKNVELRARIAEKIGLENDLIRDRLADAAKLTDTNPTEGQKEAENYKTGKMRYRGMIISIENPKGSVRRGTSADGVDWSQKMQNTYGRILGTLGADGDHLDIFFNDESPVSERVFIVNQVDPQTGAFDEEKVMLGFDSAAAAKAAYLANYSKDWNGFGSIDKMSWDAFSGMFKDVYSYARHLAAKKEAGAATKEVEPGGQRSEDRGRKTDDGKQKAETKQPRTLNAEPSQPAYSWAELSAMKQVALWRVSKEVGVSPGGKNSEMRVRIADKIGLKPEVGGQGSGVRELPQFSLAPPVESEAFKKWFGDSKVVDADGNPLVFYHGTTVEFDDLSATDAGGMIWFGENEGYSIEEFAYGKNGRVISAYLSLKNPLDLTEVSENNIPGLVEVLDSMGVDTDSIDWETVDFAPDYGFYEAYDLFPHAGNNYAQSGAIEAIKNDGFDGVLMPPEAGGRSGQVFIVFSDESVREVPKSEKASEDAFSKRALSSFQSTPVSERQANGTTDGAEGQARFSLAAPRTDGLGFYSPLEKAVEGFKQETFTVDQLRGMIRNAPGVKAEELEDLGLEEFLATKNTKITKTEVLEFIRAGGPQIQEVVKGGVVAEWEGARNADGDLNSWTGKDDSGRNWVIRKTNDGEYRLFDENGGFKGTFDYLPEAQASIEKGKFGNYQLPGGENYREVLLTLPDARAHLEDAAAAVVSKYKMSLATASITRLEAAGATASEVNAFEKWMFPVSGGYSNFQSSHWTEPNVLAHVRLNDRTGPNGEKILFVEEIQSDWHQAGRKKGYQRTEVGEQKSEDGIPWITRQQPSTDGVPNAPFKKSWSMLAFKRVLRMAAEQGYESVAWTPGEVQAERYDLSKQVEQIVIKKFDPADENYTIDAYAKDTNQKVISEDNIPLGKLEEYIGKDAARHAIDQIEKTGSADLRGTDLKVGGEGMKGFYDQILPKGIQKYVGKMGGKVGTVDLRGQDSGVRSQKTEVWNLPIPAAMRESVMQGQPRFALTGDENRGIGGSYGTETGNDEAGTVQGRDPAANRIQNAVGADILSSHAASAQRRVEAERSVAVRGAEEFRRRGTAQRVIDALTGLEADYERIEADGGLKKAVTGQRIVPIKSTVLTGFVSVDRKTIFVSTAGTDAEMNYQQTLDHETTHIIEKQSGPLGDAVRDLMDLVDMKSEAAQRYRAKLSEYVDETYSRRYVASEIVADFVAGVPSRYGIELSGAFGKNLSGAQNTAGMLRLALRDASKGRKGFVGQRTEVKWQRSDFQGSDGNVPDIGKFSMAQPSATPKESQAKLAAVETLTKAFEDRQGKWNKPSPALLKRRMQALEADVTAESLAEFAKLSLPENMRWRLKGTLTRLANDPKIGTAEFFRAGLNKARALSDEAQLLGTDPQSVIEGGNIKSPKLDAMRTALKELAAQNDDQRFSVAGKPTKEQKMADTLFRRAEKLGVPPEKMSKTWRGLMSKVKQQGKIEERQKGVLRGLKDSIGRAFDAKERVLRKASTEAGNDPAPRIALLEMWEKRVRALEQSVADRPIDDPLAETLIQRELKEFFGEDHYLVIRRATSDSRAESLAAVIDWLDDHIGSTYSNGTLYQLEHVDIKHMHPDLTKRFDDLMNDVGRSKIISAVRDLQKAKGYHAWMKKNGIPGADNDSTLKKIKAARNRLEAAIEGSATGWSDLKNIYNDLAGINAEHRYNQENARGENMSAWGDRAQEIAEEAENSGLAVHEEGGDLKSRGFLTRWLRDYSATLPTMGQMIAGGNKRSAAAITFGDQMREGRRAAEQSKMGARHKLDAILKREEVTGSEIIDWKTKLNSYKTSFGEEQLTVSEMMDIYAVFQDIDAGRAFRYGMRSERFAKNEGKTFKVRNEAGLDYDSTFAAIYDLADLNLTDRQKRIVKEAVLVSTELGTAANDTSMQTEGIFNFTSPAHWRLKRAFKDNRIGLSSVESHRQFVDVMWDQMGFTKDRTDNSHPVLTGDFFSKFDQQVNDISYYTHMTIPLRMAWEVADSGVFTTAVVPRLGTKFVSDLKSRIREAGGIKRHSDHWNGFQKAASIIERMTSVARITLKPTTYAKVRWGGSAAGWGVLAGIDHKAAEWFLAHNGPTRLKSPVNKKAVAALRSQAFFEHRFFEDPIRTFANLGTDTGEALFKGGVKSGARLKAARAVRSIQRFWLIPLRNAGLRNTVNIYKAALSTGKTQDEALRIAEEVIFRTENPSDPMQETNFYAGIKDASAGLLVPFQGQPTIFQNLLLSDWLDYRWALRNGEKQQIKASARTFRFSLIGICASAIISTAIGTAAYLLAKGVRKPDDMDDEEKSQAAARFVIDTLAEITGAAVPMGEKLLKAGGDIAFEKGNLLNRLAAHARRTDGVDMMPLQDVAGVITGLNDVFKYSDSNESVDEERVERGLVRLVNGLSGLSGGTIPSGAVQTAKLIMGAAGEPLGDVQGEQRRVRRAINW